jgi:hypothetical protein
MNDILAFVIGLVVGTIGGAGAMWATLRPIARIEALMTRAERLLPDRQSNI